MKLLPFTLLSFIALSLLTLSGCDREHSLNVNADPHKIELEVTATAYTSHSNQTDNTPFLAAWNNSLKPGIKAIAVSRDLLNMGLTNGSKVSISGLEGEYVVLDKMHKRWQKKIDIYMGVDLNKAKNWGKQKVVISWRKPPVIASNQTKQNL